jgi:4-diphosphocytidyl-2-C-methyl-D-erythritol kinase
LSERARTLAPAKVNLALRVLRKRRDGYHDIDTLFQAIDLCDEVGVELAVSGLLLEVEGAGDLGPVEHNLAYRAAAAFLEELGSTAGARVRLVKRIPVGSGLGGGSSDAAAVLRCLSALLGGVGADKVRAIGAALGSDVPFFLGVSPMARGRGRGELLQALTPLPAADLVVVSPPVHVSTAEAYRSLGRRIGEGDASEKRDLLLPVWSDAPEVATNDFQSVIAEAHPEVAQALTALRAAGARLALMTGSGSTCFGLFGDRPGAEAAAARLADETGWPCTAARTLEAFPEVVVS